MPSPDFPHTLPPRFLSIDAVYPFWLAAPWVVCPLDWKPLEGRGTSGGRRDPRLPLCPVCEDSSMFAE